MTEAGWLACAAPGVLLRELRAWVGRLRRKWQLFALVCLEPVRAHIRSARAAEVLAAPPTRRKRLDNLPALHTRNPPEVSPPDGPRLFTGLQGG